VKTESQLPFLHTHGFLSCTQKGAIGFLSCICSGSLSTTIFYISLGGDR